MASKIANEVRQFAIDNGFDVRWSVRCVPLCPDPRKGS
jgi:hypothetical protein